MRLKNVYGKLTRAGNPQNPGRALYSHWYSILSRALPRNEAGRLFGEIGFGPVDGMRIGVVSYGKDIGPDERPNLEFGPKWAWYFQLTAKGEFRIAQDFAGGWGYSGSAKRDRVARYTFLRWSHIAREYVWWVDTEVDHGGYQWSYMTPNLTDWGNKIPYLSERAMGAKAWGYEPHWMKLVPHETGWAIRFSRLCVGHNNGRSVESALEKIEHYDALREKRYKRAERQHLIDAGIIQPRKRAPRLTEEEREERRQKSIEVIVAHMSITQPARTTSLVQAPEEEGLWPLLGSQ